MKIGILTFCNGENYGASLQCFALKQTIEKMGYNVEVINFYKQAEYGKEKLLSKAYIARMIYNLPFKKSLRRRTVKFEEYNSGMLSIFKKQKITEELIAKHCDKFDLIVFGSDQIWNLDSRVYDKSKVYFGDFDFDGKKISYAASFGDDIKFAEENAEYIINKLSQFHRVSVREKSGNDFLINVGIDCVQSPDPTLIVNESLWEELVSVNRIIKQDYILYYSVNCRKYSWRVAQKLSKETGLEVINLVPHPKIIGAGFKQRYDIGPIEFLNLVRNASYVVTNSFHGTVFSIIFQKPFLSVFDEINGEKVIEERKHTLLNNLGLTDHEITGSTIINEELINTIKDYDFSLSKKRLIGLREGAIEYLKEGLCDD
jgi:hypothetical protein